MNILVTGGAGYIGSHTIIKLLEAGHSVVVVDNLSNSSSESIKRVEEITGRSIIFYEHDLRDKTVLDKIFAENDIDSVIHMAGLKAVGESFQRPLDYYDNNICSSIVLFEIMQKYGVKKLVFSSSATVYGSAHYPYSEDSRTGVDIASPYGQTKYIIEQMMKDIAISQPNVEFVSLRYFNPVGAHKSGKIGEDPSGVPNNLMPFIAQTAMGIRDKLLIFGGDYPTVDGTGVRDYIHVEDLAIGHLVALEKIRPGFDAINLGSGSGTSVMQMLRAFEKACHKSIPYEVCARRDGDLPEYYADATKAKRLLGWKTEKTIDDMCEDVWRWQSNNPKGYR